MPLGGVIISDAIAETFRERPFPGGLTYSGHPLACASGVASIQAFEKENILDNVRTLGQEIVDPMLRDLADRHPSVGEIRGLGLMWAIELVKSSETREMLVPFNASGPDAEPMKKLDAACKAARLWPFIHFNRIHIAPPLIINEADLKEGISIIDSALSITDGFVD